MSNLFHPTAFGIRSTKGGFILAFCLGSDPLRQQFPGDQSPAANHESRKSLLMEQVIVYTVEGNSGDSCRQNHYAVGYYEILGYGTPAY